MRARIIDLAAVTSEDEQRWRDLSEGAETVNAWLDPRFVVPAVRWREMVAGLRIVVVEDERGWHGLLPIEVTRPLRRIPLTTASSHGRFMTWHADRRHPLIRAGMVGGVLPLLVEAAAGLGSAGTVRIGEVPRESAWMTAAGEPARGRRQTVRHAQTRALVTMRAAENAVDLHGLPPADIVHRATHLSKRTRRSLLINISELEKDLLGAPVNVIDRSAEAGIADAFIDFQSLGWKGNAERGGAGFALDERHATWAREVIGRYADDGDLSVWALVAGDRTLAMNISLRTSNVWCGFVDAYDDTLRQQSPGKVLRLTSVMLLTRDGRHMYDTGLAVAPSDKGGMFNGRAPVWDLEYAHGWRAAAAQSLISAAERWRDRQAPGT
ncbi:GNAT family N-acetyltransferase [Demequina aestuarii]|uniref:GNAT family N-acetyltransferase n=1 Tax=Demequina aestuarii TaxID=327095 RepID=UPI0007815623|nr:GNAT family N-acetyltransferase [Demequina aestuarii]